MNALASFESGRSEEIEWKQLWSLAALYASIVIGWIAYHNYQPKLLTQFNFTEFSLLLLIVQGIILAITPPIAGKLGDRFRFQQGHRLPIISAGISFAAMIFMSVAFTLFANPNEVFKWILPILIIFWLIAMSIFTSPALSTLELFTPVEKLPRAMAILTIVANLVYSLEPVIIDLIDYLGAPITFMIGGVAVFASGYALQKNSLSLFKSNEAKPKTEFKLDTQRSEYGFILICGISLGFVTTVLFNYFPSLLGVKLSNLTNGLDGKWLLVAILVLSAVVSLPISNSVNKYGTLKTFWASTVVSLICLGLLFSLNSQWLLLLTMVIFTISFTTQSVSSLPLAIGRANYYEKVYCVGIFFSGVAIPDGIVEVIQGL
jgi:MFS family permease